MRLRRVRRVPLVDGERLVVSSRSTISSWKARSIRFFGRGREGAARGTRVAEAGRSVHPDEPARRHRHDARAQERFGRLLHLVKEATGLPRRELAETALEVVLGAVIRRITPSKKKQTTFRRSSVEASGAFSRRAPRGPDRRIDLGVVRASALPNASSSSAPTKRCTSPGASEPPSAGGVRGTKWGTSAPSSQSACESSFRLTSHVIPTS